MIHGIFTGEDVFVAIPFVVVRQQRGQILFRRATVGRQRFNVLKGSSETLVVVGMSFQHVSGEEMDRHSRMVDNGRHAVIGHVGCVGGAAASTARQRGRRLGQKVVSFSKASPEGRKEEEIEQG